MCGVCPHLNLKYIVVERKQKTKKKKKQSLRSKLLTNFFLLPLLLFHNCLTGYPTPSLRWLKDGLTIDESWTVTPQGIVRNELVITRLRRGDLMSTLVCEANNSNLTEAISTAISLELNCKYFSFSFFTFTFTFNCYL